MDDHFLRAQNERRRQVRIKKAKRKNMIIYIETLIIVILAIALIVVSLKYNAVNSKLQNSTEVSVGDSSLALIDSDNSLSENDSEIVNSAELMKAEVNQWYLKLVNPDNSVSEDFINAVRLKKIADGYHDGTPSGNRLDERMVNNFNQMCEAAKKDNIVLWSESAYRDYSYQKSLLDNRISRFKNQGYSDSDAKEAAKKVVAVPGTSEHHLGLAVDINSVQTSFENTKEFEWLQKNAADFGFIMRYPKEKQEITKIIYEPWHYRYVGVEHAKAINSLGMCLEEYIEFLSTGGEK